MRYIGRRFRTRSRRGKKRKGVCRFRLVVVVLGGRAVICAAVSALVLNMANSVETFTDDHFEGSVGEDGGSFSFSFPDKISSESQLLMKSLILGLENIRDEYGAEYIKFRFREV